MVVQEVAVVDTATAIRTGTTTVEGADMAPMTTIPMGKPKGLGALAAFRSSHNSYTYTYSLAPPESC